MMHMVNVRQSLPSFLHHYSTHVLLRGSLPSYPIADFGSLFGCHLFTTLIGGGAWENGA